MNTSNATHFAGRCTGLVLTASVAAAMAITPAAAQSEEKERCYGIAKAGKNDCASGSALHCAGSSTRDYQGNAWQYVKKGTCVKINTPKGKGSLKPVKR